jgi:hypothetical protein
MGSQYRIWLSKNPINEAPPLATPMANDPIAMDRALVESVALQFIDFTSSLVELMRKGSESTNQKRECA